MAIKKEPYIPDWEIRMAERWTTNEIRNLIWAAVECDQPIPGCVSVEALRKVLKRRGLEPIGYHNS